MILQINATTIILSIVLLIVSYLLGSIPFGLVIGKTITGIDVREHGSKNIGTTNCIRVLGKKVGYTVFFFDVLKGAIVIILVKYLFEPLNIMEPMIPYIFYGLAAIIGHLFSIYLKFKGGKAVAVSLGVVMALTPLAGINCLIVFGLVFVLTGYVCLCSSFAALTVGTTVWILHFVGYNGTNGGLEYLFGRPDWFTVGLYTILVFVLIFKHKENFKRLKNGTENCFKKKKIEEWLPLFL